MTDSARSTVSVSQVEVGPGGEVFRVRSLYQLLDRIIGKL